MLALSAGGSMGREMGTGGAGGVTDVIISSTAVEGAGAGAANGG